MSKHLTDALVRNLKPPKQGLVFEWDDAVKGFGVRVTAAGVRAFVLTDRIAGRQHRITIGRHPAWSGDAALVTLRRDDGSVLSVIAGENILDAADARLVLVVSHVELGAAGMSSSR